MNRFVFGTAILLLLAACDSEAPVQTTHGRVQGPDVHRLDRDKDGWGCEG